MPKQSQAAPAAIFPITLPPGDDGTLCVSLSVRPVDRIRLGMCLLDNVVGVLQDAAMGETTMTNHLSWTLTYMSRLAMALVDSTPESGGGVMATVMAIGDSGRPELCDESGVVEIDVVPNLLTPAVVRYLARDGMDMSALQLLRVRKPTTDRPYVSVDVRSAPYMRYMLSSGPVMGDWFTCAVRHERDARDPLFAKLSAADTRRLMRALLSAGLAAAQEGA